MMNLCPEIFPVISASPPVASDALLLTCDPIKLVNANGCLITIYEDLVAAATPLVYTVDEGATEAEAKAGTYPLAVVFPIWRNGTAQTSDAMTRQTDAVSSTYAGTNGDWVITCIYIPADILTDGRDWIQLEGTTGNAGNLVTATYMLDGIRFAQVTPPSAQ